MKENSVNEPLAEAFNGGQILKSLIGEKWEGSQVSYYVKSLLNYFQDNKPFDLFSMDNLILNSFAAFCQKGDNIDRLSDYLIQCGFSDYSVAFGLYGATRGFASLPKSFTNNFINGDKNYLKQEYTHIYSYLFKVNLQNIKFPFNDKCDSSILQNEIDSIMSNKILSIEPKTQKQPEIIYVATQDVHLEETVQSPKAFISILKSFPNIKRTKAYKALVDADFENDQSIYTPDEFRKRIYTIVGKDALKRQRAAIDTSIELEGKIQDPKAFLCILDNVMKPSNPAYKKIASLLKQEEVKNSFDTVPSIHFALKYIDIILAIIQEINPVLNEFALKQLRKDLIWFLDPQYSKGKTELELLELFRLNLISSKNDTKSKNGKDMKWKNNAYRPLDIEKTIQILKDRLF